MTTPRIDARTRLVALLGDPVEHSLSPVIQNAAFAAVGVPGVYLALRTTARSLPHLLRGLAGAGGAGNVTVPHKEAAASALDRATAAVDRTGACNTFWAEGDAVCGDNTDVQGFRNALADLLPGGARDARVLLIGAGGAARAALAALETEGAGEVMLMNRTPARAQALLDRFRTGPLSIRLAPDVRSLGTEYFDVAVNCTSLGLRPGDDLPLDPDSVRIGAGLDLVYSRDGTPWTRLLARNGIPSSDGIEMLIQQGAAAFELWWGMPAPIEIMRRSLLTAS